MVRIQRCYYEILGVAYGATLDEIKSAYRKGAKQTHPDANRHDREAEEKFKELGEAYETLADLQKRAAYDRSIRGSDIQCRLQLTSAEARSGVLKQIRLRKLIRCSRCDAKGHRSGTFCSACQGAGRYDGDQLVQVTVPPKTDPASVLRCEGLGAAGLRGGPDGDLLINLEVKDPPPLRTVPGIPNVQPLTAPVARPGPPPVRVGSWYAIAFGSNGVIAYYRGAFSPQIAVQFALDYCRQNGGVNIQPEWCGSHRGYIAIACWGYGGNWAFGYSYGQAFPAVARELATQNCRAHGGWNPWIFAEWYNS